MRERYLIVRLSALGDIVHTLPAFAALRRHRPGAHIAWAVSPKGRQILDLVPGLDDIIVIGAPGWLGRLKDRNRVSMDFQGLIKSAFIGRLSGSRRRLGFGRPNLREPAARFFTTERLEPVPESDHVIRKNLRLLRLEGIDDERFEFPLRVPERDRTSLSLTLEGLGRHPGDRTVVLNVGAAWPTKRWFPDRWIAAIGNLDRSGLFPVLLWGTDEERRTAGTISRATGVPLLPFLPIPEILALLLESALLVSGDTFALQAACALGTPVVGLFGPTDPSRNGPFSPRDRILHHELPCGRCYRRSCENPKCLLAIEPGEVSEAIRGVLAEGH